MDKIICIAGPTASGKTALAVELAKLTGGEVVSCDSMQVYRRMDIGTAKPTREEMEGIPHHMLDELGFEIDEFGENTVLLRQIPMDLSPDDAAEAAETLAADLLSGRREKKDNFRDELLHTVACKAAIKAGWRNDEKELLAICKEVMSREDLKYCPHGRPICVSLSKKQLEKQFKRS